MFCGSERVIDPAPFVTTTWLAVPVSAAETGLAPVLPINNWPLVGAAVLDNTPPKLEYKKDCAVRPEKGMTEKERQQLELDRRRVALLETQGDSGKIPAGYRQTADGNLEPIPGGPADIKAQALATQRAAGTSDVDLAIGTLRDAYDRLEKGGGITSTAKGGLSNLSAAASSSGAGQAVGKMLGTNNQSARNDIAMTRPALLAAIMKSTGMSAKQMDSNAELKLWLATATDPTLDVESNRRALDKIEKKYLGGPSANQPVVPKISAEDQAAIDWANANPNDPRAAQIKQLHGIR